MGKKQQRDPNAPKRNLSAYLLFQNAMRDTFKSEHPGMSFGQLSKHTSVMYSALTPDEKAAWLQKAESDKTRYLAQISKYIPPPGFDARGDAILPPPPPAYSSMPNAMMGYQHNGIVHTKPTKKVKCRDPHAPKRNLSAYLLYQNAMRFQFKADNPGMTFGQLSKYTSHMYRSLTPQEKAQWEARSIQDKARFEDEMSRYVPPPGFDAQGILIDTHASTSFSTSHTKKTKKPRDPNAPKRARGSYVFFTNHIRPIIMKDKPDTKFVELGAIMGQRWRNIVPEEKQKFEALAHEDRNRFNREMEAYNTKKAEAAAESANQMIMPQVTLSDHTQMQQFQSHHMQSQGQQNDEAAAILAMVPDQQQHQHQQHQHQQAYQAMAHAQPYLSLDPNQVYSGHNPNLDPNQFQFSSANQFNTRGV